MFDLQALVSRWSSLLRICNKSHILRRILRFRDNCALTSASKKPREINHDFGEQVALWSWYDTQIFVLVSCFRKRRFYRFLMPILLSIAKLHKVDSRWLYHQNLWSVTCRLLMDLLRHIHQLPQSFFIYFSRSKSHENSSTKINRLFWYVKPGIVCYIANQSTPAAVISTC